MKYKVIKTIVKGYSMENPTKYSDKIIAKLGTILFAEKNYSRIGAPTELRTKSGKFICDLESPVAKDHCEKVSELQVTKNVEQIFYTGTIEENVLDGYSYGHICNEDDEDFDALLVPHAGRKVKVVVTFID